MSKHFICLNLLMLFITVECEQQTYRYIKIDGNRRIPQDIVHDIGANTVTVTIGDISKYKGSVPTVNFHDFDTGYVVFKDIASQMCLLSFTPIPFATPSLYNLGETNLTRDYTAQLHHDVLPSDKVQEIAGERISSFCHDYKTYFMNLTKVQNHKREATIDEEPCTLFCSWCLVSLPKDDFDSLKAFG